MKNFKFCGVSTADNKVVYGNGIVSIVENNQPHIYLLQYFSGNSFFGGDEIEVYPDSISQFVCYDENGKEIYAGDIVEDEEKNIYQARMIEIFSDMSADKFIPAWKPKKIFMKDK